VLINHLVVLTRTYFTTLQASTHSVNPRSPRRNLRSCPEQAGRLTPYRKVSQAAKPPLRGSKLQGDYTIPLAGLVQLLTLAGSGPDMRGNISALQTRVQAFGHTLQCLDPLLPLFASSKNDRGQTHRRVFLKLHGPFADLLPLGPFEANAGLAQAESVVARLCQCPPPSRRQGLVVPLGDIATRFVDGCSSRGAME